MAPHLVVSVTLKRGRHKGVRGVSAVAVAALCRACPRFLGTHFSECLAHLQPTSCLRTQRALHEAHPNLQASAMLVPHVSSSARAQSREMAAQLYF